MKFSARGWALFACLAALVPAGCAGSLNAPVQGQNTGLDTPWDVRKTIADVLKQVDELRPVLAGLNPEQWASQKGASGIYVVQRNTAQRELNDLAIAADLFSKKIENLSLGLDFYFRLEALDVTARSLDEGAREYSSRSVADKLAQLIGADFTSREQLRGYLRDLAKSQEENFKIADEEAQRCRGTISKEALSPSTKRTKR